MFKDVVFINMLFLIAVLDQCSINGNSTFLLYEINGIICGR